LEVLAAPDKMRGTLSAVAFAAAIARGARSAGASCTQLPISDGGEGFADLFGGQRIELTVEGPLGDPVLAGFFLRGNTAFIAMADAAGRSLLAHPTGDEPMRASTRGVGDLLLGAAAAGAQRIIVGCGGSATTDGGAGCVEVVEEHGGLGAIELIGATDVTTTFIDAARVFAPQKGATPDQVAVLTERLRSLAASWRTARGVDVTAIARTGAAGGFGGGLVLLGGRLESGFDVVAEELGLAASLERCDLLVTGEGRLDATTLEGKSIASLLGLAPAGSRALVIAGEVTDGAGAHLDPGGRLDLEVCDLTERFGGDAARERTAELVELVVAEVVGSLAC